MKFIVVAVSMVSLTAIYGFVQSNSAQNPPTNSAQTAKANAVDARSETRNRANDKSPTAMQAPVAGQTSGTAATPKESADGSSAKSGSTVANVLSIISLVVSSCIGVFVWRRTYLLNRTIAERTVAIEAQKLLLEINKQFISDPDLFAIYDDSPGHQELIASKPPAFLEKVKALAYMNLNVFEIVFAVLPPGTPRKTWEAYFKDTIERCSTVREELDSQPEIYHSELIAAYRKWQSSHGMASQTPSKPATPLSVGPRDKNPAARSPSAAPPPSSPAK